MSILLLSCYQEMSGKIMIKTRALDGARMREHAARPLTAWLKDLAGACAP